jgi:hypothetical protein
MSKRRDDMTPAAVDVDGRGQSSAEASIPMLPSSLPLDGWDCLHLAPVVAPVSSDS